ncbi:MAG: sigma-70 family RNA polymerase sigma factor [Planctomycetes bacterium]|nr:sigma-70 family RNA polymerase sigma factor [Planctomycetota bacterium]
MSGGSESPDPASTEVLVAAAVRQDRSAKEQLLVRHLPGLEAFVRLRMGAALRQLLTAPDVVQSVCREVLEDLTDFEFRGEAAFRHWLYVRAENKLRMQGRFHKAQKRDRALEQPLPDASTFLPAYRALCSPSEQLDQRETMRRVEAAFDLLPDDYREAVTLHKLCGLSHAEIAARMQKSEGAVRNLVYRGISRLALLVDGGDTR